MIELVEQTIDSKLMEYLFTLSYQRKKKSLNNTAKAKLINELQKIADEEIYPKRVSGGLYEFYNIK